jgi:serine/threonine-protein kinase
MASDIGLKIDNRYEILSQLGRGGMGVVYKANDPKMDRVVAIKVMTVNVADRDEYRERFLREARAVAKLQHPNIVVVYDYGYHEGAPYMAMEYLEGATLDRLVSSGTSLSLITRLDYVIQVCNALQYAHQFGIVHRDVKPGNVMVLEGRQRVKLLDFGIARAGAASMLSKSGMAMGTIYYMSPEQTKGQRDLDGRADVFSAGVVLYELVAGTLPWKGESDFEVMSKVVRDPHPSLSAYLKEYPPALDQILDRALAKNPEGRYQQAEELASDLAALQTPLKEALLDEARASADSGDLFHAHELVSEILRVDTRHGEALEFRNHLQQIAPLEQQREQLRQLQASAQQAFSEKRYQEALSSLEQALAIHRTSVPLLQFRDAVRQELRRHDEVQKKLELARRAHELNDLPMAEDMVDKALELDPNDTQARRMKSALRQRLEAEARQQRLQDLEEGAQRSLAARRFSEVREAIRAIEALDASFPVLATLKQAVVEGEEQTRRRREMDSAIREVQQILSGSDLQQSLKATEQALARFPNEPALVRLRAQAEAKRDAAEREQGIREQAALARSLAEQGQIPQALEVTQAALQRFGADTRLRLVAQQLQEMLERQRQAEAQQAALAQALEAQRAGKFDTAVRMLSASRLDFPSSEEIAAALESAREAAAKAAAEAEQIRQKDMVATLQAMLATEPNPDAQVQLAEDALRRSPGNETVQTLLVAARLRQSQIADAVEQAQRLETVAAYAEALEQWQTVAALYAEYPQIREQIARLQAKLAEANKPQPAVAAAPPPDRSATVMLASPPAAAVRAPEPPPPPPVTTVMMGSPMAAKAQPAPAPVTPGKEIPARESRPEIPARSAQAIRPPQAPTATPAVPSAAGAKQPASLAKKAVLPIAAAALVLIVLGYFFLRPAPGTPIHFETTPAGAQVTVDGKSCSTPCDLKLKAGDYSVKASRAGLEPVEKHISVGNVPKTVALELAGAAPALGSLGIASNVEAADVLVDGAVKGVTSGKLTTIQVLPGEHEVRLEKNGFQPSSQHVTVRQDATASLSFTLAPGQAGEQPVRDPYLIVKGQPGARIAVDKNSVGMIQGDGTFSLQTKPGKHRVELSLDGYEPWSATVSAQAGESVPVNAAMKAIPKPPASIGEFIAAAGSIQPGQATELRWQTQNASDVSIDHGVGSVSASGSQRVTPAATTTYVLTARGNGAPAQSSVTISVVALPKPSIALFTAGSDRLESGQETKLSWATQNANEVAIDQGIGNVEASGSRAVRPARSTTYVLTAKGPGGSVSESVQVAVVAAATPVPAPAPVASVAPTAPPENPDIKAVHETIEQRYREAYESMAIDELQQVWPTITKPQKDAINGTFKMYKAIKVRYTCAQPVMSGDTARCTCGESVTYTTNDNKRQPPVSVSIVFELKKNGGTWYVQNRHGQ